MIFDRIHTATGTIEDGFYAVEDSAAPNGMWVFRVKTNAADDKHWPGRQIISYAKNPLSRTVAVWAVLLPEGLAAFSPFVGWAAERQAEIDALRATKLDGPFYRLRTFRNSDIDRAAMDATRRLLTSDTRNDAGMMYARVFGRCRVCNRKLTHPDSVATGIGPECAGTRRHEES